ncbi:hypothetical protein LAZ67_15000596 [Cordylochernes scorpioides]|uniref:Transposase n=1 Tax=Cordylochernes scorpioides TaxID=51811 RepID=A0ABY6L8I3_9ARAC|nr:hypothetical protein LAZ67_15000596 [Cordylochernes scorpioides]
MKEITLEKLRAAIDQWPGRLRSCVEIREDILNDYLSQGEYVKLFQIVRKRARKETASLNLEATTDNPELLKRVITGDETWIYGFDSETTQQASEWRFKNEPRPKKARKAPSKVKVMFTVFFDYQGIVHHEFKQQGSTITADSYLGVLRTTQHLCSPNPLQSRFGPLRLLPFWKAQKKLKGRKFQSIEEIKVESKKAIKAIPKTDYQRCFADWKKRWLKCIAANGDYFEGDNLNLDNNWSPRCHPEVQGLPEVLLPRVSRRCAIPWRGENGRSIFSKIFTDLEISEMGLTLMSRRSLGRRIENHYETQVAKIKSKLKEASYVCTEIDIWSSKKRSFIGVTAHWITNDLRRVSVALACQRFKGVHSYNRLSDIIQEINDHFDLNTNKIVASVTDNGSNFVKAFKMFGVKLTNINIVDEVMPDSQPTEAFSESDVEDDESSNLEDPEHLLPAHLRCCAHTLSLCATTDANKLLSEQDTPLSQMHAAIMKKCNALWKAAGRPKSAEIMQNVLGHTLSRPGETRWNSLFDALQQIFDIKEKSLLLHRLLNIKNAIKDNEFECIQEYLTCTSPVAEALDIMQSETNAYYGIVLPCLLALRKKFLKIEKKNNFSFCNPLVKAYRESVEKRFEKMLDVTTPEAEIAAIAALSYPRLKNKWLTCFEPADRTKILKVFKTCISEKNSGNIVATVATTKSTKENLFFNFDSDSDSRTFDAAFFLQRKAKICNYSIDILR